MTKEIIMDILFFVWHRANKRYNQSHWRRPARDPIHTAGAIFMRACEFAVGGAGLMVSGVKI